MTNRAIGRLAVLALTGTFIFAALPAMAASADKGAESAGQIQVATAYAEGLACWRAREFAKAADAFEGVAKTDPPSSKFAKRARALIENPPLPEWTPVNTLEGK